MDWTDVKNLLLSEVVAGMANPKHGEEWVESLGKCADGERLGICIAIDVLSRAIPPQTFTDVVESIDPKAPDVREEFGKAISASHRCDDLVCSSGHYPDAADGVVYAR